MNNLLTRTISGVFLLVLVFGSILLSEYSVVALVLAIFSFGLYEYYKMFRIEDKSLFYIILVSGQLFIIASYIAFGLQVFPSVIPISVILIMSIILVYYLFDKKVKTSQIGRMLLGGFWISTSLVFFLSLGWEKDPENYHPALMILLFSFIWINDTGAYLFGSLFGRHTLAPAISPGKTVEGLISGIILNAVAGYVISFILTDHSALFWIITGITVSLSSTAGDLFESKLKREAGVKDAGNMIPGHGGVLDRFDSLFFSAPLVFVIFLIWNQ